MRVHNETLPASGKEMRKKIFYDEVPLSQLQDKSQGYEEQISEADVNRAFFMPEILHEGLHELIEIYEHPGSNSLLNLTSDGRVILVEDLGVVKDDPSVVLIKYRLCRHS